MGCRIHKKKNIYKKNLRGLLSQPQAYYRPWIGHWWKFIWFSIYGNPKACIDYGWQ
jgi:hypothetical protein